MTTSTTNYGFIKQEITDPADISIMYNNFRKATRILKGIESFTSTGAAQRLIEYRYRTTTMTNISAEGTGLTNGYIPDSVGLHSKFFADWDQSMGDAGFYSSGYLDFNRPGYYRVAWCIYVTYTVQGTNGLLVSGLAGYPFANPLSSSTSLIRSSFIAKEKNPYSLNQSISNDIIIKVTEQDESDGDAQVANVSLHGGGTPYNAFYVVMKHMQDGMASIDSNSWCMTQFVRPL